jgi:hypothetical protein
MPDGGQYLNTWALAILQIYRACLQAIWQVWETKKLAKLCKANIKLK